MSDKYKIIVIKTLLLLSIPLFIIFLYFDFNLERQIEYTNEYYFYEKATLISFAIYVFLGIITFILMIKIDIRKTKSKSAKYKIKCNNYSDFEKIIFDEATKNNYDNRGSYKNNLYQINYVIKEIRKELHIIAMISLDEMSEEIYEDYNYNYFEDFGNTLIDNGVVDPRKNIYVIYIICVNKVNKYFSKYTEANVKQYYARYNLSIGVSFGSNTLYIATQEDGFAKGVYKKIKKEFMQYADELIVEENNKLK